MISKFHLIKAFLFAVVLIAFSVNDLQAQSNWELGVRLGSGVDLDATIPLSAKPRLHAAAYFNNHNRHDSIQNFGLAGYFDWMFTIEGQSGLTGLKVYPGVGPEFFFGDEFNFGIAGDFGIEYSFDFPLTVGLDWRPGIILTHNTGFHSRNWGLTARFRFGEGVKFKSSK